MSFGKMRTEISIYKRFTDIDKEGFKKEAEAPIAVMRGYREDRHGNESWRNRAAYSSATTLFRFRSIPGLKITPELYIYSEGDDFNIISVENVRNRGMYIEALCERVTPNGKGDL